MNCFMKHQFQNIKTVSLTKGLKMGETLTKTVRKLSSNFPLNTLFNLNAEHVCHKERKIPLFSTWVHVAAVVCHYSEPQDRSFQLGSSFCSTGFGQALQNPDAAQILNNHLEQNLCAEGNGGPKNSYRYPTTHRCNKLAPSLLHTSSREGTFSTLSNRRCFLWKQTAWHQQDNSLTISHLGEKKKQDKS